MKDSGPRSNDAKLSLKEVIAMGMGGMVGGGIFSVLGLAIAQAGHAAPIAFALGGIIALLTGLSYAHLGLAFQSSGGSFTFLEHAFKNRNIAAIGGWLLLVGYVGTMALYAYTFGVYGSAMLGSDGTSPAMHHLLETLILLTFMGINLYGIKASGTMFGTARLGMAREKALPTAFGFRRKQNNIPWVSLVAITLATLIFVNLANLTIISSFASSTFLLIFAAINLSTWRLRRKVSYAPIMPLIGLLLSLASWLALMVYLWKNSSGNLLWIGLIYLSVIVTELLFSQRRLVHKVH